MLGTTFGSETLLLPAIAMAAVGAGLILLLLRRTSRLSAERDELQDALAAVRDLELRHARVAAALEEARLKAEGASEAKSRFLATVSHEFRTPLNGILGMADLLLATPLAPEQTTYAQALRGSAESFLSLIEEILDFSKIEAGRIDLADEPVAIEAVVQGVVELLAPRAQDKGIEIAAFVAADVPARVRSDRDHLRQVLFNLAGNAVKFTGEGGVGITVERGAGEEIVFTVADTGPGIPADRRGRIFEEFEQAGPRAERGAGTGLGLAITRRLVSRMGGRIELDSEPGRGSAFRVRLPSLQAELDADEESSPAVAGLRVLLVGASPFGLPTAARILRERGAEPTRETDVEAALAHLAGHPADVLVADAALGEPALRRLSAAAEAAGLARRIVLLSPFERRDFGSPHIAGFDAFLMKPVRARSLLERVAGEHSATPRLDVPPAATPSRDTVLRRVLLAEDEPVNALVTMRNLQRLGAAVDWAKDGTEALRFGLEALSGTRPHYDLVLMDMRMPGLDGQDVTRRIREREAETGANERLRIVALSASLVGRDRERYRETAGFDGFLLKPVRPDDLARELVGPDRVAAAA